MQRIGKTTMSKKKATAEVLETAKTSWIRHRFRANYPDYRPVKFPPPGPYWCSGTGDDYSIVIAYLPETVDVREFWPEASQVESEPSERIVFTDRFPRPNWWKGEGEAV
jgi:hypothetical protein